MPSPSMNEDGNGGDDNDDNDDDGDSWLVGSHPCQQDSWQPTSVNLSPTGKTKADDDHDDVIMVIMKKKC